MYIHPEEMLPEETFAAGSHSSRLSGVKTVKDSVPAYPGPQQCLSLLSSSVPPFGSPHSHTKTPEELPPQAQLILSLHY